MSKALNIRIAMSQAIKGRIEAQEIKGPTRQAKVALEMLIGAVAALKHIGREEEANALSGTALLVSIRGIGELP